MGAIGHRQILYCDKGRLRNNPQYISPMGMGDESSFERTEKTVKGNNDEDFSNMINYKVGHKTFQINAQQLSYLQHFAAVGGADCQVVGEKELAGYTGVFDFTGDNFLGVDFELTQSAKERSIAITGEVSVPPDVDALILQNAQVAQPINLSTLNLGHRGIDSSKFVSPNRIIANSPANTLLCNDYELIDRVLKVKTIGNKLVWDRTKVTYLNVSLELTINRVTSWELLEYLSKSRTAALKLSEKNNDNTSLVWDFAEGVMHRVTEYTMKKSEGNIKLKFNKNIAIRDLAIDVNNQIVSVVLAA